MADLKKEEKELIKKLDHKQEEDWKALKSQTKDLLAKKQKDLEGIYEKETSKKETELEKDFKLKDEKFQKEIETKSQQTLA